ncbi:MAG TPA: BatA domain-containing protein [Tepidisphaeraceae bacterium]|jgi:hypothetical protein|nr:BatA domain-containing protein [Tepidisphaeraceae bacterium]
MTFLMGSSLLLAGLLAVSIPIIIHLLHRQKTTPLLWGAMMFLKESPLQMKRRKDIDYWLLMLLRMAALALLAWLLARPLFNNSKYNPLAANQPADVAVVLDHSMSMGRHSGDHTLFEEAQGVVDQLTDASNPILRAGDTFSIVLAEHRPRELTPVPLGSRDTTKLAELRKQLHGLHAGTTDCSIPEAIEAAREVLKRGRNIRKMVLVVSDQQRANWAIGEFAAWQRALGDASNGFDHRLEVHSYPLLPDDAASNITVGDIAIQPSLVGVNRPVQLTSTISNSGPKDVATLNIHLSVNGQEVGAPQSIPSLGAGQTMTVRFDHTFTTPGSAWVRVWTDVVDSLAADNESVAAIHVWQKLPVLVIDGQLTNSGSFKSSQFLTAAMQPVEMEQTATALIQPKVISVSDSGSVNLDDYYAVVLNDVPQLPADFQGKLAGYVSSGHGLWVVLGPRTSSQFVRSLGSSSDGGQTLFTADLKASSPRNEKLPPAIEIKDPNNPMVAIVSAAERNALAGAVTKQWWSLTPRDADAQVVLASTTGDPLIMERPLGGGRVVVWATSAEGDWNNWPAMPNFVPLVNEAVYYLSAPQTRVHSSGNIEAGASIAWSSPANPAIQKVDVTLPDGTVDAGRKATFRNGRWEFTYPNAFLPGLYQLHFSPTEIAQPIFYGVSIDRRELDNTPLSADDNNWLQKGKFLDSQNPQVKPSELAFVVTREDKGMEIWKVLALFVLASLVAETYMTYRMTNLQKKIDVAGAGLTPKV